MKIICRVLIFILNVFTYNYNMNEGRMSIEKKDNNTIDTKYICSC